ncbi:uncharacterized protein LOC111267490 isoform X2 [Varroa jacobsoni]|uniref:uncharacterized protein LOC111267490 isoform X2 n=1 Tax=Varroa jacobsoni TaxID=62625 RepID=UPI000BF6D424|nr:uncharacterized protein LOC111267490 isoform X2 [Varroa jacobsoni]
MLDLQIVTTQLHNKKGASGVEKRAKPDLLLRSTSDDGRPYNDQEDQPETLIELYEWQQHMKQIDGIDRISKYGRRRLFQTDQQHDGLHYNGFR